MRNELHRYLWRVNGRRYRRCGSSPISLLVRLRDIKAVLHQLVIAYRSNGRRNRILRLSIQGEEGSQCIAANPSSCSIRICRIKRQLRVRIRSWLVGERSGRHDAIVKCEAPSIGSYTGREGHMR